MNLVVVWIDSNRPQEWSLFWSAEKGTKSWWGLCTKVQDMFGINIPRFGRSRFPFSKPGGFNVAWFQFPRKSRKIRWTGDGKHAKDVWNSHLWLLRVNISIFKTRRYRYRSVWSSQKKNKNRSWGKLVGKNLHKGAKLGNLGFFKGKTILDPRSGVLKCRTRGFVWSWGYRNTEINGKDLKDHWTILKVPNVLVIFGYFWRIS